jgi:hypothetical protein
MLTGCFLQLCHCTYLNGGIYTSAAQFSAMVKNEWSYTSTPPCLYSIHRDTCTCTTTSKYLLFAEYNLFFILVPSVYKVSDSIPAIKPTKVLQYTTTSVYSTTKINHLRFNGIRCHVGGPKVQFLIGKIKYLGRKFCKHLYLKLHILGLKWLQKQ